MDKIMESKQNNQIKAGVILTYIGTGLNMLIQLFYTPVMIRLLGQSEYGIYILVASVAGYLGILSFGINTSYIRFHTRVKKSGNAQKSRELNGLFVIIFLIIAVIALLSGLGLTYFSNAIFGGKLTVSELRLAKILLGILSINIAMTLFSSIFEAMISAYEQFIFQRVLNILGIVFNPLICLPLLIIGYNSVAMIIVTTAITVTKLCINICFCMKKLKIKFSFGNFNKEVFFEIGGFSFFIFLNLLINELNNNVDKLILAKTSGSVFIAIYGVSAQINNLFFTFSSAVTSVFTPKINKLVANKDINGVSEVFIGVGRIQFFVLGLILSGFILFGKYFITNIYLGKEYTHSYYVSLLLLVSAFIPSCQNSGIEIQRAMNKHQIRAIVYLVIAVVNVIISIPLAIKFNAIGTSLGTAISLIIGNNIVMNLYYAKVIKIDIKGFFENIFALSKALIIPIVVGIIMKFVIKIDNTYQFLFEILIYIGVYLISYWFIGFDGKEKNYIVSILKK